MFDSKVIYYFSGTGCREEEGEGHAAAQEREKRVVESRSSGPLDSIQQMGPSRKKAFFGIPKPTRNF